MVEKPTLMHLRRRPGLDTGCIAEMAGLPLREVYLMEIGGATSRDIAVRVMEALSLLVGQRLTVNDVEYTEKERKDGEGRKFQ